MQPLVKILRVKTQQEVEMTMSLTIVERVRSALGILRYTVLHNADKIMH